MIWLWIGLGSAIGGMARFVLSQVLRTGGRFPWATLTVNVVGSLAFGILAGWLAKAGSGEWVRSVRFFYHAHHHRRRLLFPIRDRRGLRAESARSAGRCPTVAGLAYQNQPKKDFGAAIGACKDRARSEKSRASA